MKLLLGDVAGGGRMWRRYRDRLWHYRGLFLKAKEPYVGAILGLLAAVFPNFDDVAKQLTTIGATEAAVCGALLGFDLAGMAVLTAMGSPAFAVLVTADDGGVESDFAHFYYAASLAALSAILGGVQMFWSSGHIVQWGTQALVAAGAASGAATVLYSLKLLLLVGDNWGVIYLKLSGSLYRARVEAGQEPGGKEFLQALDKGDK